MDSLSFLEFLICVFILALLSIFIRWLFEKKYIIVKENMMVNFCLLLLIGTFTYIWYNIYENWTWKAEWLNFVIFIWPIFLSLILLVLYKLNKIDIKKFDIRSITRILLAPMLIMILVSNIYTFFNNKKASNFVNNYVTIKENFNKNWTLSKEEILKLKEMCSDTEWWFCSTTNSLIKELEYKDLSNPIYYYKFINEDFDYLIQTSELKFRDYAEIKPMLKY